MKTENKILKAAVETFLQYGFHGTRIQKIAEIASVNKAEIFYYFKNKELLYKAVLKLINSSDSNLFFNIPDLQKKVALFIVAEVITNKKLLLKNSEEISNKISQGFSTDDLFSDSGIILNVKTT
ncbi:MAG: TetR family transcriptional regulator [Cytophagaceae bacterium]|nr:TetR family transcriptional regulator [Cytophagaceae bacterium]MBL0324254.1 TetR family transcriptional regulator [Cytophagaceae bacterium]